MNKKCRIKVFLHSINSFYKIKTKIVMYLYIILCINFFSFFSYLEKSARCFTVEKKIYTSTSSISSQNTQENKGGFQLQSFSLKIYQF